jgi:hypothetical protein
MGRSGVGIGLCRRGGRAAIVASLRVGSIDLEECPRCVGQLFSCRCYLDYDDEDDGYYDDDDEEEDDFVVSA